MLASGTDPLDLSDEDEGTLRGPSELVFSSLNLPGGLPLGLLLVGRPGV